MAALKTRAFFIALLMVWTSAWANSPDMASNLIRHTSESMIEVLEERRAELEASPELIYGLVEEIVLPNFDFPRITRFAMGRHWRKADAAQREALISEFRQMLVRTYAKALLNYSGQEINYLPVRPGKRKGQVSVHTEVTEVGAPPIPIIYQMHLDGDHWKVYDLAIDGVSLVSNYRSSFNAEIRRNGIDGLINKLHSRNSGSEK